MKLLTIIPARGGSKGIIDKNIVEIKGAPLIAYTIGPALEALKNSFIDELILSTDSDRIASVGKEHGVSVPFMRPANLANDTAKSIDFVLHALDFFANKGNDFDAVMILQPTSPLRTYEDIRAAVVAFREGDSDSLISVYEEAYINELVMYRKTDGSGVGEPLNPLHNKGVRRQEHQSLYVRNGCIYITRTSFLRESKLIISDNPLLYIMRKEQSINLDTPEDLNILRKVL